MITEKQLKGHNTRIVHLIWSLTNGGIENMLVDIINCQVKEMDVSLIILNDKIDESIHQRICNKCHIIPIGRQEGSRNIIPFLKLNYILYSKQYDIIHLHDDFIKYIYVNGNYIMTLHAVGTKASKSSWIMKYVGVSKSVEKKFRNMGFSRITTIYNGIKTSLISEKKDKYYNGGLFKIVQVGRIYFPSKGQDILLQAVALIKEQGFSNIIVDFIGEGPNIRDLEEMCIELNMKQNVRILGNRDREYVYSHLKDYDLFVQPSRIEGFGLTIVEAMAARIPVLVSNNYGPEEIVDYGEFGFLFENENVEDCAKKLVHIIQNYPSETFIQKASERVKKNYSIEMTSKLYTIEYKRLITKK